jgi:signal transduction histidine kinase
LLSPSASWSAPAERGAEDRTAFRPLAPDAADCAAELAHDARNFIAAVNLCCELLAAPGVLTPRFSHYAADLRQIGRTGARLIEELAAHLSGRCREASISPLAASGPCARAPEWMPATHPFPPIEDLADELVALESPLQALAGADVRLEIECSPCPGRLGLNSEALLRILFNLVGNAVEAMRGQAPPAADRRKLIRIAARRGRGDGLIRSANAGRSPETVVLSIRDNGPGIAPGDLLRVFDRGFSTRAEAEADPKAESGQLARPSAGGARPRGHGLAIVRRLVESAGGAIRVVSSFGFGARFDVELPLAPVLAPRLEDLRPAGCGTAQAAVASDLREFSTNAQESGV